MGEDLGAKGDPRTPPGLLHITVEGEPGEG